MKLKNVLRAACLVSLCVLSNLSLLKAQVQTPRYNTSMTPNSGGFYEYLPQGYDPNGSQTYPLLIFCHGSGEAGNGSTSSLPSVLRNGPPKLINQGTFPTSFVSGGQTWRFIVISPQFAGWPQPGDINDIINYCTQHYKVNVSKIYLTGLSMGGGVTWDYPGTAMAFANRLAALVPVCGASSPENSRARNIANSNLPVWATHNSGDGTVPVAYTNGYIDMINAPPAPNPPARKTIFAVSGHDAWSTTYNPTYRENGLNVYEWMLQYQRSYATNQAPVADAGPDINLSLPPNSVQLTGNNSWDFEGPITNYSWTYVSGPTQYSFNNSNIANPIVSNLVAGTYVFRLTVTDNQGATASDNITINAVPVHQIPGRVEAETYFNMAGVSTDPCTDIGGGLTVSYIDNGDWMDYNLNAATAGTYTVGFRVATINPGEQLQLRNSAGTVLATLNIPNTGGWQTWTTITANVTLPAGYQILRVFSTTSGWNLNWLDFSTGGGTSNQPPVPRAGPDQIIVLPANSVTLDGTGSTDDHTIASYQWTKLTGTGGTITSPNSAITTFTGLSANTYTVELRVTDDNGVSARDTVQVMVNATSTGKAIPGFIEAENYDIGSGVGIYPTTDAGGGNCVGSIDNGDAMDYNVTVTTTGTYTVSFRVATINNGGQFQLKKGSTVLATVQVPYTAGWQTWATVTASVSLTAGAQTLRVFSTGNPWNLNWMNFTIPSGNQPPTANAGPNQTVVLPTTTTQVTGSGSDPDGTIMNYVWTQTAGTTATIQNPSSATTNITGLNTAGPRTFRLTVTDNGGATATSDVVITEVPATQQPNQLPVARAGTDQTITLPTNSVSLNGTASTDDHSIVSYVWSKIGGTGSGGTFANMYSALTTFDGLSAGTYIIELAVVDDSSTIGRDTLQVTVNPAVGGGNGMTIPGHIEAESYSTMSGVGIYPATDAGGGNCVGSIDNGDWMDYNVTVTATGTYNVNLRVATVNPGAQLQIRSGTTVLLTASIPNTGGWQTWSTISGQVSLTAGAQTLRIYSSGGSWNLNWMDFIAPIGTDLPPVANAGIDQVITAPASSVTLDGRASTDDQSISAYLWTRVGGNGAGGTLTTSAASVTTFTGLSVGTYLVELKVTDNNNNIGRDTILVTVNPAAGGLVIPGHIEAEDYTSSSGVGLYPTTDAGGGQCVGSIDNGDWFSYNVTVTSAGTYAVDFRVATIFAGQQLQIRKGGVTLATVSIPNTGGWQTWTTVSGSVTLPAGSQTLQIYSASSSWNLNWMDFGDGSATTRTTNTEPTTENVNDPAPVTAGQSAVIYPNPLKENQFTLQLNSDYSGPVKVQVIDQSGAIRKEIQFSKSKGLAQFIVPVSGLSSGNYFVRIQGGTFVKSIIKLVKL